MPELPSIVELETWFTRALDIGVDQRETYLKEKLAGRPELLTAVLELLSQEIPHDKILTELRDNLSHSISDDDPFSVDRYTILEELGRGGMAYVYRAQRNDGVFDNDMALKVLKKGLDTDDILQRFNLERKVLAKLKHEHIAQVYDGGVTSDGRPYFVMELVKGQDILTYAVENALSVKARCELFKQICQAVEYAHQNLILHRDIKPSNVLVNEERKIKLTDFGIAVYLQEHNTRITQLTRSPLTPAYASPEQISNDSVDVRSDIYQLGLLLKELLEGLKIPDEINRIIAYATREEKERRYNNVAELKNDLINHFSKKPIIAKKNSNLYILKKFIARNKVLVLSSVSVIIILLSAAIINLKQLEVAQNERDKAKVTADFLKSMFESIDPYNTKGDTITVQQLLSTNVKNLDQLDTDKNLLAEIYYMMAIFSKHVGANNAGKEAMSNALENISTNNDLYFDILLQAFITVGFEESRDSLIHLSVEEGKKRGKKFYAKALVHLAAMEFKSYQDFDAADSIFNLIDSIYDNLDPTPDDYIHYYTELGLFKWYLNELDSASTLLEKVIELRQLNDPGDLEIINVKNNLAGIYNARGLTEESSKLFTEINKKQQEIFGKYSPVIITSVGNLIKINLQLGDIKSAKNNLALLDEIFSRNTEMAGYKTADYHLVKGQVYGFEGNLDSAVFYLNKTIDYFKSYGPRHYMVAQTRSDLGDIYFDFDLMQKAKDEYEFAYEVIDNQFGSEYSIEYQNKIEKIDSTLLARTQ